MIAAKASNRAEQIGGMSISRRNRAGNETRSRALNEGFARIRSARMFASIRGITNADLF